MSKKENLTEVSGQKEEKIVTKYDRKMQARKEKEEKQKKQDRISNIVGILIVAALAVLVVSFPVRSYLAVHKSVVKVGGENVSRLEMDYNYNVAKNNYINQYGMYLAYMGLDVSKDMSKQMYSETLTWEDFFQQMAVESIKSNKALLAEAKAAGFTYDTAEDMAAFKENTKAQAAEAGMSTSDFLKAAFGPYATFARLENCVEDTAVAGAYYAKISEEKAASEEEINAYYEENTDSYDVVDYRMTQINAELPTEPTDLADPQTNEADETEGEDAEEKKYEPSEAEIAFAMEQAKAEADEAVKAITADGTQTLGAKKSTVNTKISGWLFDASRQAGDTTVIEDETAHRYYVVAFENRYRDDTPSVNARVITTAEKDGQEILDEWNSGAATEDSFIELCAEYSEDESNIKNGGKIEGIVKTGLDEAIASWLFAEERAEGDTTAITLENETSYVIYYLGTGAPEWSLSIKNTLTNEAMSAYMDEITADVAIVDEKGNLNYLKVQAEEEEASEGTEEGTEETEPADK